MAKTILTIGNGFDKRAGLQSSFTEYMESEFYSRKMDILKSLKQKLTEKTNSVQMYLLLDKQTISASKSVFDGLNFWDLYFGLLYYSDEKKRYSTWNEFEESIRSVLFNRDSTFSGYRECLLTKYYRDANKFHISNVLGLENGDKNYYTAMLCLYLAVKNAFNKNGSLDYLTLLNDLKLFEKDFGEYVHTISSTDEYGANSRNIINGLIDKTDELIGIDNFNYTNARGELKDGRIWHINGGYETPIFGIDDKDIDPNDGRYIFTKVYRRMELYGDKKSTPKNREYSKVVVYGHSLNEQDYSYYYPLFNKMGFDNSSRNRRGFYIVFKYSGHGNVSSEMAKVETIKKVIKLLKAYNDEVLNESNFRLLDVLYSENKIRFEEY